MRRLVAPLLALALLLPATAGAEEYDPRRAGHPLRIVAYCLHPVGVILDYLVFRPAWYIGGVEPIRTLVGREPNLYEDEPAPDPDPVTP